MGIRLYPECDDATLESLAGVSAGSLIELKKFTDENPRTYDSDADYERYVKLQELPIGKLDTFITFGWGKFKMPQHLKDQCGENSGQLVNKADIKDLLADNNISVTDEQFENIESVCWC